MWTQIQHWGKKKKKREREKKKNTCSTHCQIKTQAMFDIYIYIKKKHGKFICLTHKCTWTCEMRCYHMYVFDVEWTSTQICTRIPSECQTQFMPVWFKNKQQQQRMWRMCNAFKDGNLTDRMRNIKIICFSSLDVSHTEKCLMTRDYANIWFPLVCFASLHLSLDSHWQSHLG